MMVHLLDGTYELFRHFYGQRRFNQGKDVPFGAVAGVLHTVLEMIEKGATHLGVATDHVIESFRNGFWPGYKTGQGIERGFSGLETKYRELPPTQGELATNKQNASQGRLVLPRVLGT
jgi:hypothetical protein